MIKKLIYFLFVLISTSLFAQQKEYGLGLAVSGYLGDLNPKNPVKFTDPGACIFYRHNNPEFFAYKFSLGYYGIQGADSLASSDFQKSRNLSFNSKIYEFSFSYEFNFLPYIPKSKKEKFAPYVFLGLVAAWFNPTANYKGQTYNLRNLGTEGQGLSGYASKYSNVFLAIPYGLGFKWNFVGNFTLGADLNYRFCFSDYLDDVSGFYANNSEIRKKNGDIAAALADRSAEKNGNNFSNKTGTQRGDARANDLYYSFGINLSYTIIPYRCPDMKKVYKRDYFF